MNAIGIRDLESGPGLLDLPVPQFGPTEVLVRVQASSVNGFDRAVATGWLKGMMEYRFPVVLGKDFAGVVEAVGADVSRFAVGDPVFGVVMKPTLGDGGFGQYVAVSEGFGIARIPPGLDWAIAGVLGLAGTTAYMSVEAVAPIAGETVLISGATGGVGAFAIQMAAARGARVIATARPGDGTAFVLGLGAETTVDHTLDLAAQVRSIAPGGVDAVLHLAGDITQLAALLAPGGRLASPLVFDLSQFSDRGLRTTSIIASPDQAVLGHLADEVVAGRLRVSIQRTYQLDQAPRAMIDFAAGKRGKLAISIG